MDFGEVEPPKKIADKKEVPGMYWVQGVSRATAQNPCHIRCAIGKCIPGVDSSISIVPNFSSWFPMARVFLQACYRDSYRDSYCTGYPP